MQKPQQIIELEKELGFELTETDIPDHILDTEQADKYYILDKNQNIIGLNLEKCNISDISFLKDLTNLEILRLSENAISDVFPLKKLKKLKYLYLNYNEITSVNQTNEILKLPNLVELGLGGNDSLKIPFFLEKADERNLPALRDYFLELEKDKFINDRAKLVIVGNGRIGKTSLFKRLQGLPYNPDEKYTHGIQIGHLEKEHLPEVKTEKLNASVWDFGGQEVFYATHQFFMTDDAVYILAWTTEEKVKAYREKDKATLPTNEKWQSVEYWLDTIRRHAPKSPILVVQTHTDCGKEPINEQNLQKEFEIKGCFNFSALKGFGLAEIQDELTKNLNTLPMFGQDFPKTYENVILQIENRKSKGETIILYSEFVQTICRNANITEGGEGTLLKYLDKTGLVVHYPQNPKLKDFIYINPDWLTKQVYSLINNNLHQTEGKITKDYLEKYLPDYEKLGLLELSKQFDLIFEAQDEKEIFWISPQYLPEKLKSKSFDRQLGISKLVLVFRFSRFMPDNVMINFVSRYGSFAKDDYWKNGIFFTKYDTNCIVLKENETDLQVWIDKNQNGKILLKELVEAFSEFGKNAKTEISLGDDNKFVDYDKLKSKMQERQTNEIETVNDETVDLALFKFLFEDVKKEFTKVAQNQLDRMETKLDKVDKTQDELFELSKDTNQDVKNVDTKIIYLTKLNEKIDENVISVLDTQKKQLKEFQDLNKNLKQQSISEQERYSRLYDFIDKHLTSETSDGEDIMIYFDVVDTWWSKSEALKLQEKSQIFLMNADFLGRALEKDDSFDYTPAILQYCRILEHEFKVCIIKPFVEMWEKDAIFETTLSSCEFAYETDRTEANKKLYNLADLPNANHIMFGNIIECFECLSFLPLPEPAIKFSNFLNNEFHWNKMSNLSIPNGKINLLENEDLKNKIRGNNKLLTVLNIIKDKYRNFSAHDGILYKEDLHNCQILVQEILKVWTASLKIKS